MMAVEQPQSPSFLKRSTSLFRRLSKRESGPPSPSLSTSYPLGSPRKLQRRPIKANLNTQNITHLHTIEIPQNPRPLTHTKVHIDERQRVLASDMRTHPFPASPFVRTVAWNVFLTPEQAYSLVVGSRPVATDDQWFVYAEGPDHSGKCKVHFHRSWTGTKIAELFLLIDLKGEGAGKIVGIKWNGSEQTNGMEQDEVKYMVSTACAFVMGVNLEGGVL